MTVDCQWIEKNLEGLFCGALSPEENRVARAHIENCGSCAKEVASFHAIDPLVKTYFQRELNLALRGSSVRSRTLVRRRLIGLASAALVAASLFLVVELRTDHQKPVNSSAPVVQDVARLQIPDSVPPVKSTDGANVERSKPVEAAAGDRVQTSPVLPAAGKDAPEFLVTDPAGYSRTLNDYRGHVLVIGVLNSGQPDSTSNLERLYQIFGPNAQVRVLGISNERQFKPANTTFPIAFNQGSRLFGAKPGDFLVLDGTGKIQLRGSLVKNFDS